MTWRGRSEAWSGGLVLRVDSGLRAGFEQRPHVVVEHLGLVATVALERKLLDAFDIIFQKMNVKEDVRLYSQAFFSGLVGMVATFRNHPHKSDEDVLRHRKRIARMFSRMIVDAFLYRNRKS